MPRNGPSGKSFTGRPASVCDVAAKHDWIVVGASACARDYYPMAREQFPDAKVIATNSAHLLFHGDEVPDYFLLWDWTANENMGEAARQLQQRGTKLVTADRTWKKEPRLPNTEHFDVRLTLPLQDMALQYVPGEYRNPGFSGLLATQFALNHGADQLAWVGTTGYRDCGESNLPDHLDGSPSVHLGSFATLRIIGPYTHSCVATCPDVNFTFFGSPRFCMSGPNLSFVSADTLAVA